MENSVPDFVLFLGRFHPLVVHFPIGFLFFAFLLEVFSRWKKNPVLTSGIPLALSLGGISGALACVLGYMLSLSGDYEVEALNTHFWFGIVTTAIAFLAWLIRIEKIKISKLEYLQPNISLLTLLVVLLSITGHYGGNLTHGSDYLLKYLPFANKDHYELAAVNKLEDAVVFNHLVNPILDNKCASCHNESKQKGSLSFHSSFAILKGGKNGKTLVSGNASESEMIKRVLLDPDHENFMPPEGKKPLTKDEISILSYWINNANGNFDSKVTEVETPEEIFVIANRMLGLSGTEINSIKTALPSVNKVSETQINLIQNKGFVLRELVYESGLYEVVLPPHTITIEQNHHALDYLEVLLSIKENVLWLSLEQNNISDQELKVISQFSNLQKLKLNNNPLTDDSMASIASLDNLESLNLYGTQITARSLETLSKMRNLKHLYAWQTNIKQEDIAELNTSGNKPEVILGF